MVLRAMRILVFLGLAFGFGAGGAWASGIAVSNVFVTGQNASSRTWDIQFDAAWDHSWFIAGAPAANANWDAAWVFAKFTVYSTATSSWSAWAHCTLSKTNADHTAPSGAQVKAGCSPSAACGGADAGKGIFLYRAAAGTGSVDWQRARLRWLYGADGVGDNDRVRVKVFGIEMVYIPTASFYIGDGSGNPAANFQAASGGGAVQIGSGWSAAVNASAAGGNDDDAQVQAPGAGLSLSGTGGIKYAGGSNLNAAFPVGYNAFYVMKYDVSQRQYADFLNALTRAQQAARVAADISGSAPDARYVMSGASLVVNRDGLAAPASGNGTTAPVVFGCDLNQNGVLDEAADGGWVSANDISWMDQAAYAAWAGLRPLTELEFEKAARGPSTPVADEYAWGDTGVYNVTGASADYAPGSSGTAAEAVANPAAGTGNAAYYTTMCYGGANNVCGPWRNGVFAASAATKNRQETGGSYYGVMDLSGNLWKHTVTVGNAAGRAFTGTHGSGALSATGSAVQADWPGFSGGGVTAADGSGFRGGAWLSQAASLRVSDRGFAAVASALRTYVYGARAAHTAP